MGGVAMLGHGTYSLHCAFVMDVVIVVWSEPLPASLDLAMEVLRRMRSVIKGERTASFHEPVWAAWGYGATDMSPTVPPQLLRQVPRIPRRSRPKVISRASSAARIRIAPYESRLVWRIWTRSALSHEVGEKGRSWQKPPELAQRMRHKREANGLTSSSAAPRIR
jgi:hypothetical protein